MEIFKWLSQLVLSLDLENLIYLANAKTRFGWCLSVGVTPCGLNNIQIPASQENFVE